MKTTAAERRAIKMISLYSDKKLIQAWEETTDNEDENISIVRGWLMDKIERRWPDAFDAWLDSENPEDDELKNYIF